MCYRERVLQRAQRRGQRTLISLCILAANGFLLVVAGLSYGRWWWVVLWMVVGLSPVMFVYVGVFFAFFIFMGFFFCYFNIGIYYFNV